MSLVDNFVNFFKLARFDYDVWSDQKLIGEGWGVNRLRLQRAFEEMALELNNSETGDGFTFIVRKAS
jgi:hypothetical protein